MLDKSIAIEVGGLYLHDDGSTSRVQTIDAEGERRIEFYEITPPRHRTHLNGCPIHRTEEQFRQDHTRRLDAPGPRLQDLVPAGAIVTSIEWLDDAGRTIRATMARVG